jgi:3-oxoacyl-[acyl-carrier protein] reductase
LKGGRDIENGRQRRLDGEVAIVTGGSSGIGRAVCLALAAEGARVVVVGRSPERTRETSEQLGRQAGQTDPLWLALDVRREEETEEMARRTLSRFGRIDILVACAGVGKSPGSQRLLPYPVAQMPAEEWDAVLDTNLKGTFLSNRAVLPAMIEQRRGQIVNISSARAGVHGQPFAAAYSASKFGVRGLSEALAEEVRQYGVRVQLLLPDITDTPLLHNSTVAAAPLLSSARVAELIVYMLSLPADSVLERPLMARTPLGQ